MPRPIMAFSIALFLTGCSVVHSVQRDPDSLIEAPNGFSSQGGERQGPDLWWESFASSELSALQEQAFADNLDLLLAWARLSEAKAASGAVTAGYIPNVEAQGTINGSRNQLNFGDQPFIVEQSQTDLQLTMSYEVDLWGRIYGLAASAETQIKASASDVATMYISVSAEVAATWISAVAQKAITDLLDRQLKTNQTLLELTEFRFRQGLGTALDVLQQRQQLASLTSQRPPAVAQLRGFERQLSILVGKPPGAVQIETEALPIMPAMPAVGVPSEVLLQRPDVRAAQLRVMSSDYAVGSAIAARFPRLNLTGSIGFRGFNPTSTLFSDWVGSLAAGLIMPLTDQVRLEAEEAQARAQLKQSIVNYGSIVLRALSEVEDALDRQGQQALFIESLKKQVDASKAAFEEATRRYQNGLSDYLPVLTNLQAYQSAELSLLSAQEQHLNLRVALHRALGGSWMADFSAPPDEAYQVSASQSPSPSQDSSTSHTSSPKLQEPS